MRCLLLGGGGFLGSHLAESLVEAGHAVHVFERPHLEQLLSPSLLSRVTWTEGDFGNAAEVDSVLEGAEVIFHLISTTIPKTSNDNPVFDAESNLVATLRLLERIKHEPRRVIFLSSGGTVYGRPERIPIPEEHPTNPICSYGITKLAIEKYLYMYHELYGIPYSVLRLSNPYGGRQRTAALQGAIAVFLYKALRREPIEIWGDGEVVRDYVYIDDVVDALRRAMTSSGPQRVLNIGSGVGTSINAVLDEIAQLLGHPVERRYLPAREFDLPINVLDIELAQQALGWRPATSLRQGLAATLESIRTRLLH
ncbi:MAG: NAD-dependent epimerase/dehydratase family protein [Polyangia bacterium]